MIVIWHTGSMAGGPNSKLTLWGQIFKGISYVSSSNELSSLNHWLLSNLVLTYLLVYVSALPWEQAHQDNRNAVRMYSHGIHWRKKPHKKCALLVLHRRVSIPVIKKLLVLGSVGLPDQCWPLGPLVERSYWRRRLHARGRQFTSTHSTLKKQWF